MHRVCSDQFIPAARGDLRCYAKGQGRRGPRNTGSNYSGSSKQNGGKGSGSPGSAAVPKMSAAAKAAAKRASMFSQQRFDRAVGSTAALAPPRSGSSSSSSIRDRLTRTAAAYNNSDDDDDATVDASSNSSKNILRQPYLNTVVDHLRQSGSLNMISSTNGAGSTSSTKGTGSTSRGRGAKRGVARSLLECHTAVFQAALDLELQEEWAEAEDRLKSWPPTRLAAEGVALFNLAAAPAGGVFRDVLLKFFVPDRPLPFHSFSQGDILLVSRGDPLGDAHEAVVVDYSSRWIRLALTPTAAAAVAAAGRTAAWRLDLFANTVSHERCSEALKKFAAGAAAGRQDEARLVSQQVVQQQEVLWRVLAGVMAQGQIIAAAAAVSPPWVKSAHGKDRLAAARGRVKGLVASNELNQSQAKAIEAALTRTCTLWQGPPGTGKTTTLLRFCEAAVQLLAPTGGQLLAVAASNVAVDNLVTGLLALGLKVVRIGQPVKVAAELRSVTLDVLAAATPAGQAAAKLRQQLAAAAAARPGSSSKQRSSSSSSGGQAIWEQMLALEAAAAAEVLGNVQVVAATCVGAGDPVVAERGFEIVVLDEATQAPEPAALVATAARAQALVMVGDPKQLPPTVKCRQAEQLGLGISLFDRLQAMGLPPLLLNVQYRMHPALCEFPGKQFYGGLLHSWPKPQDRPLPQGLHWPNPKVPVMFIQCSGPESRTRASISISRQPETTASTDSEDGSYSSSSGSDGGGGGYSFYNDAEAAAVVGCLEQLLLQGGMAAADVCVITPYSGQVRAIQQLLPRYSSSSSSDGIPDTGRPNSRTNSRSSSSTDSATPSRSRSIRQAERGISTSSSSGGDGSSSSSSSGGYAATKLTGSLLSSLEVKSVDGFQGREKEVVIFSAVRSNPSRRVGFLADARRLNVALTRARRGLVVVGDARTLKADKVWASWLEWAEQQGVIVGPGSGSSAQHQ